MANWRKKGDKCNQELARTKSNNQYGKPPIGGSSNWQPSVPLWEKRFVATVGSLSWKKFLEARKFTHLYNNILQWDDSAGEEAFRASKEKFYADFHGIPCHIQTHNPDLYIDQVDWNAEADQKLILELESESVTLPDADSNHDPVVIFGDSFPDPYKDYSHGWGELDEKVKKGNKDGINLNDYMIPSYNWWDSNENNKKVEEDQGWNDHKNVNWGWNSNDDNNYYGNGNGNDERRNGSGTYITSHKTTRFHGDNNHRNRSWRNNAYRRKPPTQGQGNQRSHVSNIQSHGSHWIHVHP